MSLLENNLDKVIKTVFSGYPRAPCTYSISLSNELIEKNISPFQLLMKILVDGAKFLYGESITPDQISENQFQMLKLYMESLGYSIKYNYTFTDAVDRRQGTFTDAVDRRGDTFPELDENIQIIENPKIINIWFEEYRCNIDCHGRVLI